MGSSSGSSIAAQGYRNAQQAVYGAASFNIGVVNVNEARNLNDIARQLPRTLSTQRAQASSSGFTVGSKSFQSIYSESIDSFLREADRVRENAEFERQRIWYEAQSRAAALENQALAAEAAGRAQRAQGMTSMFQGITRAFGGFGG